MPVDYYPNKSIAELTAILETLQKRQTSGLLTEVSAAGVRTVRGLRRGDESRTETEILRVLYSLFRKDSATNPPGDTWTNPYADRIRRTGAHYSGSAHS